MIPSSCRNSFTWQDWITPMAKKYRVISLDLPGFGLTGPAASQDYSMAALHPQKVHRLVLLDSAGFSSGDNYPLVLWLARMPLLDKLVLKISPAWVIRKSLRDLYFDDKKITETVVARYGDLALREGNRGAFVKRAKQLIAENGEGLEKVRAPTLILWGKHDLWFSLAVGQEFLRRIDNSRMIVYDNAGHMPQEEIADTVTDDVMSFLAASEIQMKASRKTRNHSPD